MKISPTAAVIKFTHQHFPEAEAVLLSGSVRTGQANKNSDVDIVVLDLSRGETYREIHDGRQETGWLIEAFVFGNLRYSELFLLNRREGLPTLQRMCAEGRIIVSKRQMGEKLKKEARDSLRAGPEPWDLDQMNVARYEITDLLDDFEVNLPSLEDWYTACRLLDQSLRFSLRVRERWIGEGKWMVRELQRLDPASYHHLHAAIAEYRGFREKQLLIDWVDRQLGPYGGRLKAGFQSGANV